MKNTLGDLNNHLFAEIERLSDEDLTGDGLREEVTRATAVVGVATQIINNGALMLKAVQMRENSISAEPAIPRMLTGGE